MLTITMDAGPDQLGLILEAQSCAEFAKLPGRNLHRLARPFGRFLRRRREVRPRVELEILFLLLAPALSKAAELKPDALQAWDAYVCAVKMRMEKRASGQAPFLWVDEERDLAHRLRSGEILVGPTGPSPHKVPRGLIHDWMGAVFVPKAKLDEVMGVLNEYERYKDFYGPMVVKARLLEQTQDHQKVSLLTMSKAYSVTGAVEADNDVTITRLCADKAYSISTSVRLQEIADYGKASEHLLPEDHGPGYVWRTFNITRLEQRDDGVYVEIEMIELSRDIPLLFRWLIQPLTERLPRNILLATLEDTRDAVSEEIRAAPLKIQCVARSAVSR